MTLAPIVVHVGYPKTATTTFQMRVFPRHPEIEYLGKFIPSYRYRGEETYAQVDALLHTSDLCPPDLDPLRKYIQGEREQTSRRVVLISSESFIHPAAVDVTRVAVRLSEVVGDCRILITIREQIGAILSFYWMHGRHGQFLSIGARDTSDRLIFPLDFSEWIRTQMTAVSKNYLQTLMYDEVVSCYMRIFGKKNVSVLMFETLLNAPDLYASQLGGALGVDGEIVKNLMAGARENMSENRAAPWTLRDIRERQAGRNGIIDLISRRKHQKFSADDEKAVDLLREFYKSGNRRLASELGLPVAKFGYAV